MVISIILSLNIPINATNEYKITEYKNEDSEEWLWNTLNKYTENEYITAGIMGYYWRESFFKSNAIAGWSYTMHQIGEDPCIEFQKIIDNGLSDGSTKEIFIPYIHHCNGGFGLGQWSSEHYLEMLYDYAQEWGTSIADAEMQCVFTIDSLKEFHEEIYEILLTETNASTVGKYIATYYDGTNTGIEIIGLKAQYFYNKYSEETND